jgi:hypothetical protein
MYQSSIQWVIFWKRNTSIILSFYLLAHWGWERSVYGQVSFCFHLTKTNADRSRCIKRNSSPLPYCLGSIIVCNTYLASLDKMHRQQSEHDVTGRYANPNLDFVYWWIVFKYDREIMTCNNVPSCSLWASLIASLHSFFPLWRALYSMK